MPENLHKLFVISSPSGGGKTSLINKLFEDSRSEMNTISSTYLWGNDFLISPITNAGQEQQKVDFPSTSNWYDFYTKQKHKGGKTKFIQTQENSIPTFVRGGAIVPMTKPIQSTDNYQLDNFELHYFFDKKVKHTERLIYNDNGVLANAYEKEHYEVSMKIGELVLFPTVRDTPETTLIAAAGTSCRHQIMDGTKRKALHPVEILYQALRD